MSTPKRWIVTYSSTHAPRSAEAFALMFFHENGRIDAYPWFVRGKTEDEAREKMRAMWDEPKRRHKVMKERAERAAIREKTGSDAVVLETEAPMIAPEPAEGSLPIIDDFADIL